MKRVFPLIVLLITLSVLGIIFIQMLWIKSAIELRKQQHDNNVMIALNEIREDFFDRFIVKSGAFFQDDESKMNYISSYYSSEFLTEEEINSIIKRTLLKHNLTSPFNYNLTNIYNYPIKSYQGIREGEAGPPREIVITPSEARVGKETLYLYLDEDNNYIIEKIGWMIGASIVFTLIIISAFALTVRTIFSQKKLSEIKSDFINNMTHELKTPLATISLAIDALVNDKVINDREKIKYYSGMIKEENRRMNKQVEKILQSARLERQEIKLSLQSLDAHDSIRKVADSVLLQVQEKNGLLTLDLKAAEHEIMVDEVHFSNIIFNLLDNAIKYSNEGLKVNISTAVQKNMLAVKVKDDGIGMNKETQARVFEKFYRAHTGNLHNVKGFGLGLNYVKAITEAHGGKVRVDSIVGKGSSFTVTFPLVNSHTAGEREIIKVVS